MKSHHLTALAVVLACMVMYSSALSFDSTLGVVKCFRETLTRHQVVTGEVGTTSSPFHQLKFWVRAIEMQK